MQSSIREQRDKSSRWWLWGRAGVLASAAMVLAIVAGGCRSGGGAECVAGEEEEPVSVVADVVELRDDGAAVYGPEYSELEILTESLMLASRLHVEEFPFDKLVYNAVDGMLKRMDPNSAFLAPESLELHELEAKGYFGGIGVRIGSDSGQLKVVEPIEDSPADKAGIKVGEKITAVDGKSMAGGSIEEAVRAMRGETGTTVKLEVESSSGVKREVELVREDIRVADIRGMRLPGSSIGYIRVGQFDQPTADEFARVLDELKRQKVKGVVVDLRDNPGGLLESAIGVAECLLEKDKPIVSIRTREGEDTEHLYRSGESSSRNVKMPLAVLVNRGSASAAEVLVGALKAHERGVIVGERTFGKASVQSVIRLGVRPECALRLTTAYYYTPDGLQIHGKGIEPDQWVAMPGNPWQRVQQANFFKEIAAGSEEEGKKLIAGLHDLQLERAVDILQGKGPAKEES